MAEPLRVRQRATSVFDMSNDTAPAPIVASLPLLCGPAGDAATGDMNRDWACTRSHKIYMLHVWRDNIQRDATRVARGKFRSDRRRLNLIEHVDSETERFNRLSARILAELPACTHADDVRAELTVADALPDCTC